MRVEWGADRSNRERATHHVRLPSRIRSAAIELRRRLTGHGFVRLDISCLLGSNELIRSLGDECDSLPRDQYHHAGERQRVLSKFDVRVTQRHYEVSPPIAGEPYFQFEQYNPTSGGYSALLRTVVASFDTVAVSI